MILEYIDIYKIECAVLNTFISGGEYVEHNIEPFKMESKYFQGELNKMLCDRVMKQIEDDLSMGVLSIKLSAWVRDIQPRYKSDFLNIICNGVLPMSVAKKYYEEMKIQYMERLANGRN